ncbi:MAG: NADH-quinone oxidoreductase subunit L [Planctomycetota bacterium]|nr:NADH-quinone oxidoreductase subunit L [Planctomycetota bacterium]
MDMTDHWLPFAIVMMPFLGFLITGLFGRKAGKGFSSMVSVGAPATSFVFVATLYLRYLFTTQGEWAGFQTALGTWFSFGSGAEILDIQFLFQIDHLTLLMCMVVTGVGTLIHIYSCGYMSDVSDTRFARFMCYLNLFMGMMLILVTGGNMLLLFIGWEGVGLCSYLLIGFEYEEDWKAAAGMKAFIVNRVGDMAFILGMIMVVILEFQLNGRASLSFDVINAIGLQAQETAILTHDQMWLVGAAALCFFIGATGKSAQIPLFVWLPDAMAGPTPVSALIHAATMVTAGIYMIVRISAFFVPAVFVLNVPFTDFSYDIAVLPLVATVGALTAFLAATAAVAQTDIKKVLAYSTVSQLGYMMMGVGAGAFSAAIFHLMTHAFFKALLFLAAGAVIHALHGEQNMMRMGGLRKKLPVCFWAFMLGGLALAGFPLFSGFFSKDMILFGVYERYLASDKTQVTWLIIWLVGLSGAFLTAFYTFRMLGMTFFGKTRLTKDEEAHIHRPGVAMKFPLQVLMVFAVIGGFVGLPAVTPVIGNKGNKIGEMLSPSIQGKIESERDFQVARMKRIRAEEVIETEDEKAESWHDKWHHIHHAGEIWSMLLSVVLVLLGLSLGYMKFFKAPPVASADGLSSEFFRIAWGLDLFYTTAVGFLLVFSVWLHRIIDVGLFDKSLVEGSGRLSLWISELVTAFQTGKVTRSAVYIAVGAIAMLAAALTYAV